MRPGDYIEVLNHYIGQFERVEEDAANLNMSEEEVMERLKAMLIDDLNAKKVK